MANGITVSTGNDTSPPNATKFQTKDGGAVGHVPAVLIGYSDGSDAFVTSDASGLAVQGTTTLSGVSASTATVTSVGDAASDTELLAANANRVGWSITNVRSLPSLANLRSLVSL